MSSNDYHIILFDLDGTVTDSGRGIINSVAFALQKFGINESHEALRSFIGPPLNLSFMDKYGFDEEEAQQAVAYYREYYEPKGMYENDVYPGIEDLLKKLISSGKTLFVATSKPTYFSEKILQHFGLAKYFKEIVGSDITLHDANKTLIVKRVLDTYSHPDKQQFVMIGDREHDIIGAKNNGTDSIGVLYGYGSEQEMQKASPTYIAKTVADLEQILLS